MKSFIPLIRNEWQLLLFGFMIMFFSSPGQTYFIALFSGEIRESLSLSHGEFGGIYSLATLCSAAILLWSGSLIDRMDLRTFSYIVVAGLVIGCLVTATSQNAVMLFIGILLLRHFGQGLMSMTGATTMVRYIEQQKGKATALAGMGISVSEAILPSLVILLVMWLSWRESWVVIAIASALLIPLLIYKLLQNHDVRHKHYESSLTEASADTNTFRRRQWTRAEVIRDSQFYLYLPALMGMPFLFTGFMFHQVHMVEEKSWSLVVWGSLYIIYALVTVVTKLFTGLLIDRYGAEGLVPLIMLPMGLGLLALSGSSLLLIAVVFMILTGISVGAQSTLSAPFFSEKYGNQHLGSIKSLATSMMVFMSALSPVLMGWMIDLGVSINALALGGAAYAFLASGLGYYAYQSSRAAAEQN